MNEKTYTEVADAAKFEEYAWIKSPRDQELSDELDRVMKINPHWRDMYLRHGREIACLEFMYEKAIIECSAITQKQQQAIGEAVAPLRSFEFKNWHYLHQERHWPINRDAAFSHVQKTDAAFIAEQRTTGFPTDELKRKIADRQKEESEWLAWEAFKKHRDQQAEADRQRKKEEAGQRQAAIFAKEVAAAAEKMLQEMLKNIVASGVFRGK